MFSNQSKKTIVSLIKDIIKGEKDLECIRQQFLFHLTDQNVSLIHTFLYLSFDKNELKFCDMETFLQGHSVRYEPSELRHLKYASYSDFLELVLPSNQLVLKQLKQKEMHLNPPVTDTFLLLAKLIAKHIEIVRRSRAHIETLLLRYDRSQLIAFLCPQAEKGAPSFIKLLENIDLDLSFEDVILAMRRLDVDGDSDVRQPDWAVFFEQNHPKKSNLRPGSSQQLKPAKQSQSSLRLKENSPALANQLSKRSATPQIVLDFQLHLIKMGKLQDELEEIQLELSARGDYSLERCLGFFDLNMDNEVDEQDLSVSLLQLGLPQRENLGRQLLALYSENKTSLKYERSKTRLEDLKRLFPLPIRGNSSPSQVKDGFSYETKKLIKLMLLKLIDMINFKSQSLQTFIKSPKSYEQLFYYIDQDEDGYINQHDFLQALDVRQKYCSQYFAEKSMLGLNDFISHFQY